MNNNNTQKYKLDINHAPYGIFISDTEGRYLDVNSEACSIQVINVKKYFLCKFLMRELISFRNLSVLQIF